MTLVLRSNRYVCFEVMPLRFKIYNEWRKYIVNEDWSQRIIEQKYNDQLFVYISDADFTDHVMAYVVNIPKVRVAFHHSSTKLKQTKYFMDKVTESCCNDRMSIIIYRFGIREMYCTTLTESMCAVCGMYKVGSTISKYRDCENQVWAISKLYCNNCECCCKGLWYDLVIDILTRLLRKHNIRETGLIKKILDGTHYENIVRPHVR